MIIQNVAEMRKGSMGIGRRDVTVMNCLCWERPKSGENSCGGRGRWWQVVAGLVSEGVTAAGELGWKESS